MNSVENQVERWLDRFLVTKDVEGFIRPMQLAGGQVPNADIRGSSQSQHVAIWTGDHRCAEGSLLELHNARNLTGGQDRLRGDAKRSRLV